MGSGRIINGEGGVTMNGESRKTLNSEWRYQQYMENVKCTVLEGGVPTTFVRDCSLLKLDISLLPRIQPFSCLRGLPYCLQVQ